MMKLISKFAGALGLVLTSVAPISAMDIKAEPVAVLELFTSQGCSSCPPADEILGELAKDKRFITLAYHVDYWNYIGWEDTFSQKAHSDLQRQYARANGEKRIYTPQMIINGRTDVVGSYRDEIDKFTAQASLNVKVEVAEVGDMLSISIPPADINLKDATVWLVPFVANAKVDIGRGENRGRSITYSSIVKNRQLVGMWMPQKGVELSLPVPQMMNDEINGLAILVQERTAKGLPGRILGAVSMLR